MEAVWGCESPHRVVLGSDVILGRVLGFLWKLPAVMMSSQAPILRAREVFHR